MLEITYNNETFYLSDKWGWLNADFIAVPSDLQVKLNRTFGN